MTSGAWWWMGVLWPIVAAIVVIGFILVRSTGTSRSPDTDPTAAGSNPRQLLAKRYALGEIDEEEYRRRLAVLDELDSNPAS